MEVNNECDLLIIGGGAAATAVLAQFSKIKPRKPFRLIVVEQKANFGCGFPYDKNVLLPEHLVNIAPGCINITHTDIRYSEISDFMQWLEAMTPETRKLLKVTIDPFEKLVSPPPRWVVGEYMMNRFQAFVIKCRTNGFQVTLISNMAAVNIVRQQGGGYAVTLANGNNIHTTDVFLATGHWQKSRFHGIDGYFGSPWPAKALQQGIPPGSHVGIFGSNLSGVDAVLTLSHKFGHFERNQANELIYVANQDAGNFKMTIYSRSGQLPEVMGVVVNKTFTHKYLKGENFKAIMKRNKRFLPLDSFFELFKQELFDQEPSFGDVPNFWEMNAEEFMDHIDRSFSSQNPKERLIAETERAKRSIAEQQPIPSQNVFYQSLTIFDEAMQYFSAEDAIRFKNNVAPTLHKLVGPIPIRNAEIILALMNDNRLCLESVGDSCEVESSTDNMGMNLKYEKDGQMINVHHRYFIDALGQSGDIEKDPSPLIQSLLRNRLAQTLYVPFRNQVVGQTAFLQQAQDGHERKKIICKNGIYYSKVNGVAMDMKSSRVLAPAHNSNGIIYASGPLVYGHFAFPQDLSVVTTCAERMTEDIEARHGLGNSLALATQQRSDAEQQMAVKIGLQPNAKGYVSADMREWTKSMAMGTFD